MPQTTPASGDGNGNGRILATPLARAVASSLGVDLAVVTGSGRGGRIVRADVEALVAASAPVVAGFPEAGVSVAAGPGPVQRPVVSAGLDGEVEEVPLSRMRRVVVRRLVESMQSTPHFYLTIKVDAEQLVGFRAELNRQLQARGEDLKASVNDLVVKACAVLLRANPDLNVPGGRQAASASVGCMWGSRWRWKGA
jgi:pyruvate dehydrogenase E2 component (dihydrolipoamide acetyltransferase)